jgi:hypothetical protein
MLLLAITMTAIITDVTTTAIITTISMTISSP